MRSIFSTAAAAAEQIARAVTRTSTKLQYLRDGEATLEIEDYGLGQWQSELAENDGFFNEVDGVDVLLPATALDFGAGPTEPHENDQIIVNVEGQDITLAIAADSGQPGWRYQSRFRTGFRIHTKVIDEVPE